jgi:hypothetical protein
MVSRARTKASAAGFALGLFVGQAPVRAGAATAAFDGIELRDVLQHSRHRTYVDYAVPFRHGVQLDDGALYRLVGRDDLARKYEARTHAANVLALTGLAALITGGIMALTAPSQRVCEPGYGMCHNEVTTAQGKIGISIAALMPILGGIALAVLPTPITPEEKTKMARDYNGMLPNAVVVPGGAGLGLGGTF